MSREAVLSVATDLTNFEDDSGFVGAHRVRTPGQDQLVVATGLRCLASGSIRSSRREHLTNPVANHRLGGYVGLVVVQTPSPSVERVSAGSAGDLDLTGHDSRQRVGQASNQATEARPGRRRRPRRVDRSREEHPSRGPGDSRVTSQQRRRHQSCQPAPGQPRKDLQAVQSDSRPESPFGLGTAKRPSPPFQTAGRGNQDECPFS